MRVVTKSTIYIIFGLLLFCLTPQLMSPNEAFTQENWLRITGFVLHAVASAFVSVSTFPEILKGAIIEMK